MSRFRGFFAGFRTALAALIVCALMTGGVFSPAAAHTGGVGKSAVDCHKLRIVAQSVNSETPMDEDGSGGCPDCCLTASFVDFMLPARAPAPVRMRAARATVVFTDLFSSDAREDLLSAAGNGARAPPAARQA
jgi:hypothetical protein